MARNPFRVRASARAVSDDQFIKTFAASAVEILRDPTNPWAGLVFVRSAPGGGKTTLLRLLTPGSLRRAISYGDDQRYRATRDALQDWASSSEDSVFELMDELGTADSGSTKGLAELDGLHWLADAAFEFDGRSIDARPILLLDDLQYLSDAQHAYLNGALTALRKPLGIWAAERLEAMQQKDLIAPGVLEGRDYDSIIRLEERWLK